MPNDRFPSSERDPGERAAAIQRQITTQPPLPDDAALKLALMLSLGEAGVWVPATNFS
jgi:hypothetical protein